MCNWRKNLPPPFDPQLSSSSLCLVYSLFYFYPSFQKIVMRSKINLWFSLFTFVLLLTFVKVIDQFISIYSILIFAYIQTLSTAVFFIFFPRFRGAFFTSPKSCKILITKIFTLIKFICRIFYQQIKIVEKARNCFDCPINTTNKSINQLSVISYNPLYSFFNLLPHNPCSLSTSWPYLY